MSASGYSGTPLPKKLGIREGDHVAALNAPAQLEELLRPLPPGVVLEPKVTGADLIVYFATERDAVARELERLGAAIFPSGSLWIAWPKRASGVTTDITEDVLRSVALPLGLVDNKVCAIDGTWSGLRLVWRKELRAGGLST